MRKLHVHVRVRGVEEGSTLGVVVRESLRL